MRETYSRFSHQNNLFVLSYITWFVLMFILFHDIFTSGRGRGESGENSGFGDPEQVEN